MTKIFAESEIEVDATGRRCYYKRSMVDRLNNLTLNKPRQHAGDQPSAVAVFHVHVCRSHPSIKVFRDSSSPTRREPKIDDLSSSCLRDGIRGLSVQTRNSAVRRLRVDLPADVTAWASQARQGQYGMASLRERHVLHERTPSQAPQRSVSRKAGVVEGTLALTATTTR